MYPNDFYDNSQFIHDRVPSNVDEEFDRIFQSEDITDGEKMLLTKDINRKISAIINDYD